jgi:TonB family protein
MTVFWDRPGVKCTAWLRRRISFLTLNHQRILRFQRLMGLLRHRTSEEPANTPEQVAVTVEERIYAPEKSIFCPRNALSRSRLYLLCRSSHSRMYTDGLCTLLPKNWSYVIFIAMHFPWKLSQCFELGGRKLIPRLRNCARRKMAPLILAATFCTSVHGQSSRSSPLPPLPPGKHYGHGCGLVLLEVDYETGRVTSARMLASTGDKQKDADSLQSFRTWQFKPHTPKQIMIPITFTERQNGR